MTEMVLEMKDKLSSIVGEGNVSQDPEALAGHRQAGLTGGGEPLLKVSPASTDQVRGIIKLARSQGANLVFTSSAPPHCRGDSTPVGEAVIVDMSRMDQIVRMDRRNKVAIIEPGVTFSRLIAEADAAGLRVLRPLKPRAGKSVLASYLEREPITIPKYHWDITDPLLCAELVFGTGDLFRTGSAAGPGSLKQQWEAGGAQKNPMGPAQTDFARIVQGSQGTMAAVTWASVKLEVKPSVHRIRFVPDDRLPRLVDFTYKALRPKLADEFFILNARALAALIAGDSGDIPALAAELAPFTIVFGVSGYEFLPEMRADYQEHDLEKIAQVTGLKVARDIPGCSPQKMEEVISNPSPEPYYKTRPKGAFLDIFFLTTLDEAESFIGLMEKVCRKHLYPVPELGVYIQPIQQGRNVHLEFTINYDPGDAADAGKAAALYEEASHMLDKAGAFYSRPYGLWSELAYQRCPDTVKALRKVKDMLDPDNVLNRGKLCFNEEVG